MIAFLVIIVQELANAVPQRIFPEKNHLIRADFLNSPYEVFGLGVQIRGPRRQLDRFDTS
jgi:hypothetical protein